VSTPKKLLASVAVLAAVAAFMSFGVFSAWTSSVSNDSNVGAASILLGHTPTTTLINLSDLVPGDLVTKCVAVTNSSTVPVDVSLSASIASGSSSALLSGLVTSIEEGTVAAGHTAGAACDGFTSATTPVYAMGTSAINTSTFTGGSAANGLSTQNYTGWAAGAVKYYQIKVALPTSALSALQGTTATLTLSWTATPQAGSLTR
jgi:hypothetical protein